MRKVEIYFKGNALNVSGVYTEAFGGDELTPKDPPSFEIYEIIFNEVDVSDFFNIDELYEIERLCLIKLL